MAACWPTYLSLSVYTLPSLLVLLLSYNNVSCQQHRQHLKSTSITTALITDTQPSHNAFVSRSRRSLFGSKDVSFLTEDHNAKRRLEPSSDMEHLKWNNALADMALDWARGCVWEHGQPSRANPPFTQIGQNLYATTGPLSLAVGMQAWSDDEKEFYHYSTGACDKKPCGHYTQVVWATSKEVGCAVHFCPNLVNAFRKAQYLVCNYGPAGNIIGVKPFKLGPQCTECQSGQFFCDEGLCRSETECSGTSTCRCAARCLNGGCVTPDCKCECQDGFLGPTCADRCEDRHEYCGANPGWPKAWCLPSEDRSYVRENCPLMCDICKLSTGQTVTCPSVTFTTAKPATSAPREHSGSILYTDTQPVYWKTLWQSLQPVIYAALTEYCTSEPTKCCPTFKTGDVFNFGKDNVFKGSQDPQYGRYLGKQSTALLVYATVVTAPQGCTGELSEDAIVNALQAAQARLEQTVSSCCKSVILGITYSHKAAATSGSTWIVVVVIVLLVGVVVALVIGFICYRKQSTRHQTSPSPHVTTQLHSSQDSQREKHQGLRPAPKKPPAPPARPPARPPKPSRPPKPNPPASQSQNGQRVNIISERMAVFQNT